MAGFSLFVDVTCSESAKIARERRNVRLSLLFRAFCNVIYATLGLTHLEKLSLSRSKYVRPIQPLSVRRGNDQFRTAPSFEAPGVLSHGLFALSLSRPLTTQKDALQIFQSKFIGR